MPASLPRGRDRPGIGPIAPARARLVPDADAMKHEHIALDPARAHAPPSHLCFDENALRPRPADYLWCIHCERAYQYGELRDAGGKPACPYVGCEGSQAEPWDWSRVRRANPGYPRQPSHGVVYPLFGRGTYIRRT